MQRNRRYEAFYDDGHDYGSFRFWSDHRANSKPNFEDAEAEAKILFGYRRASQMTITSTQLVEC